VLLTAEVNTLVKQGSALWPLDQASPQDPVHQEEALVCEALVRAVWVGATGFEPVTSSVSAKPREPLC
jgi:hypothetical protein